MHSWGGLGSQLYAIALIFELQKLYSKKKIILIHHTSGVTRREFELHSVLPLGIQLNQVDDYVTSNRAGDYRGHFRSNKFKLSIKKILGKFLLSLNLDENSNLGKIKFWTLEIRGHYTKLPISMDYINYLINMFNVKSNNEHDFADTLSIHYRLGDLVDLSGKTFVPTSKLLKVVEDVYKSYSFDKIIIFSDSIEVARKKLAILTKLTLNIEYSCAPTITVIKDSIKSKYFIGTNSKVSFWIQHLRLHLGKKSSTIN